MWRCTINVFLFVVSHHHNLILFKVSHDAHLEKDYKEVGTEELCEDGEELDEEFSVNIAIIANIHK